MEMTTLGRLLASDASQAGDRDAPLSPVKSPRSLGDPAPGIALDGSLASVPTESPRNPDPQVTWFGLRHVFVLVEMTDARLRLPACGCTRQRGGSGRPHGRRRTRHREAHLPRTRGSGARGADRSGPAQNDSGRALDLRLQRLPDFSPASTDTLGRLFRALVLVEMITPGTCSPAMPRMPAAETPPPSPAPTLRSLEDLERAGPRAAGIGQARNSIARPKAHSQDPQGGARCDQGPEDRSIGVLGGLRVTLLTPEFE